MTFELTVNMDNAAFEDYNGTELARILTVLAGKVNGYILDENEEIPVRDINGNNVGMYIIRQ